MKIEMARQIDDFLEASGGGFCAKIKAYLLIKVNENAFSIYCRLGYKSSRAQSEKIVQDAHKTGARQHATATYSEKA